MRSLSGLALLSICIAAWAGPPAPAGDAAAAFDVVSIKPTRSSDFGVHVLRGRSLYLQGITLVALVRMAYDLYGFQVAGGPDWVGYAKYDVMAKVERPVSPEVFNRMIQSMLVDRFRLRAHRIEKEMPAYILLPGKRGSKLHEASAPDQTPPENPIRMVGVRRLRARQATIAQLVSVLTRNVLRTPIVDKTGLAGVYDFDLQWGPENASPSVDSSVETAASPWPPLPAAIQEQLGLKLVPQKAPVSVLVIDSAEKPSAN